MKVYLDLMRNILENGASKEDRTGVGTLSLPFFSHSFDLRKGFPILTTRKTNWVNPLYEIQWMLSGSTNINDLHKHNVHIWDQWATVNETKTELSPPDRLNLCLKLNPELVRSEMITRLGKLTMEEGHALLDTYNTPRFDVKRGDGAGELGPVYGAQWRNFNGVDQVKYALDTLRRNPNSRRIVVSSWNPSVLPDDKLPPNENPKIGRQALAPCHYAWELHTTPLTAKERADYAKVNETPEAYANNANIIEAPSFFLDLTFIMRSTDVPVGLPYNLVGYGLLLLMFAKTVNMIPRNLNVVSSDVHIYTDQIDIANKHIKIEPKPLPIIAMKPGIIMDNETGKARDLFTFKPEDFIIQGYNPEPFFKYPVSI